VLPKRIRKSSFTQYKFRKGKLVFEKKIRTFEYDDVLRDWKKIKEEVEYLEPSQMGLKKEVKFQTLLLKEGVSDVDLRRLKRWFLLSVKVKIPKVKSTRFMFLKLLEPDRVYFESYLPYYCYELDLNAESDYFDVLIKKRTKISERQARELLDKGYHYVKEISGAFAEPI